MTALQRLLYIVALRVSVRFVIDVHQLFNAVFDHLDQRVARSIFELCFLEAVQVFIVSFDLFIRSDLHLKEKFQDSFSEVVVGVVDGKVLAVADLVSEQGEVGRRLLGEGSQ